MEENIKNAILDKLREKIGEDLNEDKLIYTLHVNGHVNFTEEEINQRGIKVSTQNMFVSFSNHTLDDTQYTLININWQIPYTLTDKYNTVVENRPLQNIRAIIVKGVVDVTFDTKNGEIEVDVIELEVNDNYRIERM